MKFLDLKGLKHFVTKIVNNLAPYVNNFQDYVFDDEDIPDVVDVSYLGHTYQITAFDIVETEMNIYNWFKDAPNGAILDIISELNDASLTCKTSTQSYLQKVNPAGEGIIKVNSIVLHSGDYIRVIKKGGGAYTVNFKTILN